MSENSNCSALTSQQGIEKTMDAVDPFEKKEDNTYSSETSEEEDLCKEWKNLTIDDEIEDEEYKRVFNRILELVEENKEYKDIFLVIGKGLTAIQKHMEYLKMTESLPWIKVTSSDWYKNALNLPKEIEAIEESVTQMIKKVKSEQVFEADTTERKVTLRILQQVYKRYHFESTLNFYLRKCEVKTREYFDRILELEPLLDI